MTRSSEPGRDPYPLRGRVALVTGASRRAGIGYATCRRLAAYGASVFVHHFSPHDSAQPWGADDVAEVVDGVRAVASAPVAHGSVDLSTPEGPATLVDTAVTALGGLDIVVCNQALSGSDGPLVTQTAATLDVHWAVNARASILLARSFAALGRPGRLVFLTSGQNEGPMPGEVAYAASKGALWSITATLADELADQGITVNTVNPGPVDTGYADGETRAAVAARFPGGRWGEPDDPARLIAWLTTDEAAWITGQVLNTEGGFRRR
ncbi:SDR family oxidoreductase [Actinophytocola algeriensis]|uniref:3-oxoacyl-[acyl-carrier protein] reductase n=1 Tax=Actinophytocola algeriensis TaxID=1768010 RepID=A0A7W7Q0K8_9PSEU|nr:SDR family oxidoreductase [Actinophytocola algeriensis]MBB4904772.1 3-oxoacyl-[acyl-carrier protein] reductase [Actinophytocola algeriensis]MBE1476369.1 3-oxoacyl-[acyl-carrier protein] reductase [Actinophytocola algeriensis]